MHVVHRRRGERQQGAREVLHLLSHLQAGHALADQGLMHVDVEEAHLGVGDLSQRLSVHAAELQEGHEREARRQHRGRVLQGLNILFAEVLEALRGKAEAGPVALDQGGLQSGGLRRVLQRVPALGRLREQLLHEAVGQPALLGGLTDLVERVPAITQPHHDPGVGQCSGGPLTGALSLHLRDHAGRRPPSQRGRRDTRLLGGLVESQGVVGQGPDATTAEPLMKPRRCARAKRPAT